MSIGKERQGIRIRAPAPQRRSAQIAVTGAGPWAARRWHVLEYRAGCAGEYVAFFGFWYNLCKKLGLELEH